MIAYRIINQSKNLILLCGQVIKYLLIENQHQNSETQKTRIFKFDSTFILFLQDLCSSKYEGRKDQSCGHWSRIIRTHSRLKNSDSKTELIWCCCPRSNGPSGGQDPNCPNRRDEIWLRRAMGGEDPETHQETSRKMWEWIDGSVAYGFKDPAFGEKCINL